MTKHAYDVLGIGTPIVDQVIFSTHEIVSAISGTPGGSETVDYFTFLDLLEASKAEPLVIPGGSAANTIKGLAFLGKSCRIFGKIGKDKAGQAFMDAMQSAGVTTKLLESRQPTAQVACLITPDNERTMRSYLGAGIEMNADELTPELFQSVKIVHIEGYLLDRIGFVKRAMHLAKEAGATVSFDLASYEMVIKHKRQMVDLIAQYVDILFANEQETQTLTGLPPERGCSILKDLCTIAIVKAGAAGCWVSDGGACFHQPAIIPHQIVDTTGAGDFFASGFLYGCLEEEDPPTCALFAAIVASHAIAVVGTELSPETWYQINKELKSRKMQHLAG